MTLPISDIRRRFPALERSIDGIPVSYLDGPGGTQVPDTVIDAIAQTLRAGVSNVHGGFGSSDLADATTSAARSAIADLFGAGPDDVVFGQNMTSLTFALSRALARQWGPGDEIVVTNLDHDANITPWRLAAADRGATVRTADFDPATGALDMDHLESLLGSKTRLVAVTAASNALGSVPPVERVIAAADAVGALTVVDAVHAAPHRPIDVGALGAAVLSASAYKFFGPHTGVQVIRPDVFESVRPYKVVPAPEIGPGKWETGTQSFESLAGVTAAVDYLAGLGSGSDRRRRLHSAMAAIAGYEASLSARFLAGTDEISGLRVYGPTDRDGVGDRTPTFAIEVEGVHPDRVAALLADAGIYTWSGHYYAVEVMRRLGTLERGGLVRIGFVHYTTEAEVDRVLSVLAEIAG